MIIIGVKTLERGFEVIKSNSYLYDRIGREACERVMLEFKGTGSTYVNLPCGTEALVVLKK